jgi:hypothetical protein
MLDPDPDEMNADPQPWWQGQAGCPSSWHGWLGGRASGRAGRGDSRLGGSRSCEQAAGRRRTAPRFSPAAATA